MDDEAKMVMANEFTQKALNLVAAENAKRTLSTRAVATGFVQAAVMVLDRAGVPPQEIANELRGMATSLEDQSRKLS